MKYYKTSKFSRVVSSTGFIAVTASLLIAIGAIGWFTLSRSKEKIESTPKNNSIEEYNDNINSYDNTEDIPDVSNTPSTDVNESMDDIPYETVSSENESSKITEEKQTFILPITGNILKGYSDTALQYSTTYDDMRLHTGVDILCDKGSEIKSVGSGKVTSIVDDANMGKIIVIDYDNNICVKYCGMKSCSVNQNDKVATGDIIGTSGDIPSECADNPHIHIEVLIDGEKVSPLEALGLE